MILQARDELGLCLSSPVLIGDRASDIAAAKAAGVGKTVLIATLLFRFYFTFAGSEGQYLTGSPQRLLFGGAS